MISKDVNLFFLVFEFHQSFYQDSENGHTDIIRTRDVCIKDDGEKLGSMGRIF